MTALPGTGCARTASCMRRRTCCDWWCGSARHRRPDWSPWSKAARKPPPRSPCRPDGRWSWGAATGVDAIYLAEHGWDVTAVDITARALGIARRAAARAGVTPRFVRGDVTRLPELGLGHDYDLLLDFGCLHTLPADRRPAYLDGVTQAAKAGATLLLYGFRQPPRPAPMFAGLTEEEVRHRFGPAGWEVTAAEPALDDLSPTGRRSGARFERGATSYAAGSKARRTKGEGRRWLPRSS